MAAPQGHRELCLKPMGFLGHLLVLPCPKVILSGKTGRTTEDSAPLEMKVEVTLPRKESTPADILPGGTGRKHGMSSRGRKL